MDIFLDVFLILSSFIFWMMFFLRKRSFHKLKKLEQSVNDKIFILEDLTDKIQNRFQELSSLKASQNFSQEPLKGKTKASFRASESPMVKRTLSLDFHSHQVDESSLEEFVEESASNGCGVKGMVKQAKENMEKIDVSNMTEVNSFKDIVLLAKKIEKNQT